jgi:hypothetical protein
MREKSAHTDIHNSVDQNIHNSVDQKGRRDETRSANGVRAVRRRCALEASRSSGCTTPEKLRDRDIAEARTNIVEASLRGVPTKL